MATVNKNFRVKNGLVVEGSTATVNGYDILTKASADQSYIVDLIGGQATSSNTANTVVKRDENGNFAAGTITATFSGNLTGNVTGTVSDISNHDTGDLAEGTNLYFTNQRALDATAAAYDAAGSASAAQAAAEATAAADATSKANAAQAAAEATAAADATSKANAAESAANAYTDGQLANYTTTANLDTTVDGYGYLKSADLSGYATESYVDTEINALDTDVIEEGASNLYFTNGRARNAVSGGTGITYSSADGIISVTANTYDAYGAASDAEGNANTYTDNAINALTTSDIEEGANLYYTDERAQDAIGNNLGSGLSYDDATGAISVDTSVIANKTYVDTAVSNLVDSAPDLLNTLNEIAAALGDDANFATTVTNGLAEKVAKAGDTMTGALTLHADPSSNLHAATKQYVDAAESAAQSAAESTAQAALDDVLDGTTDFTALDVNSVSRQIASTTGNIATAAATTALSWASASYRTAKILVKAKNGSHTHVSEVIVSLDTSDNIALNEYGITTTNGSLMTIDADIDSGNVRLRVTPANNNTEIMAHATLLV